jgi:hypothetical protein
MLNQNFVIIGTLIGAIGSLAYLGCHAELCVTVALPKSEM